MKVTIGDQVIEIQDSGAPRGERNHWVVALNGVEIYADFNGAKARRLFEDVSEAIIKVVKASPAEDVRAVGEEPVYLQHMAVAEDGVLRWMSGRKMQDCELYALPDGGAIRDELYRHPQRPVVLPERADASFGSSDAQDGWNACLDAVEELNKC